MKVWVNGRVVGADEATVSVFDHGLTVGDGVFETAKVVGGVPFALTRHLDRLASSAAGLALPAPDETLVRSAVGETLAANAEHLGEDDAASHHGDRWHLTAGLRPRRRRHHAGRRPGAGDAVGDLGEGRRRPVGAQRAGTERGSQDDVVRRQRGRAGARQGRRWRRGGLRQHRGQPLRGHRDQRVRRPGRRGQHAAAVLGLSGRRDAGAAARVGRRGRAGPADRRAHRGRRGLPHVVDARRAGRARGGRPPGAGRRPRGRSPGGLPRSSPRGRRPTSTRDPPRPG